MYFPTMPHDELFENAAVSKVGRIYSKEYCTPASLLYTCMYLIACKNGHPFAVSEVSIKQQCQLLLLIMYVCKVW